MAVMGRLLDAAGDRRRPSAKITRLACCWMTTAAGPDAVELDPWTGIADGRQTSSIAPAAAADAAGSVVGTDTVVGAVVGWAVVIRQHFPY